MDTLKLKDTETGYTVRNLSILCLFALLFSCAGCNKNYTLHESYVEKRRWEPDRGIIKSSKATVNYEWD